MANFNDSVTYFNTITASGCTGGGDPAAVHSFHFNSLSGIDHNQNFNTIDNLGEITEFSTLSSKFADFDKFSDTAPPAVEEHNRKKNLGYL